MGVGHFAAGLIFKRVDPRLNLGVLFFAAILSDFLLGIFFRLGLEHATIPVNYVDVSSVRFDFPYSHGLVASIGWTVIVFILTKDRRARVVLGLCSHTSFWISSFTFPNYLFLDETLLSLGSDYGTI